MTDTLPLAGRTIGVTADRRWEQQADLLRKRGADVLHAPTVRTVHRADEDRLRAATDELVARPPDYVVVLTGMGLRAWFDAAGDWGAADGLRAALARARLVARGPKARSAAGHVGLEVWFQPDNEQVAGILDRLRDEPLDRARVAVQLHGATVPELTATLAAAGADVVEVPVYRWALPDDLGPVHALVDRIAAGTVDAVTFTAAPAVHNLFAVAGERVRDAFNGAVLCACIGPVCAAAAREEGVVRPFEPSRTRLPAMVDELAGALRPTTP